MRAVGSLAFSCYCCSWSLYNATTREQRIQASKTSAGIIRCAGLMHLWVLGDSVPRLGVCQRQRVRPNFQLKRKSVLEGPCETAQAMPAPIPIL